MLIWLILINAIYNAIKGGTWHIVLYWTLVSIYWIRKKRGH